MLAHAALPQDDPRRLDDEELVAQLRRLVRDDRKVTARLLEHLGEVDARGLYRDAGFSSMFEYAVGALHMSESEAFTRIRVARLSREFPVVLEMLAKGELHLSALKVLAPVLTAKNCVELLRAARFKSKRQVELLLAQRFPKTDVPSVIRRLPTKPSSKVVPEAVPGELALAVVAVPENSISTRGSEPVMHPKPTPSFQLAPPAAPAVAPLRAERYKVQFTADQRLHDKLKQAQDLLSHQLPSGDVAAVVERALDLLIAERMKKRFALGCRPQATRDSGSSKPTSRHIPHDVRREVIVRDQGRCTYMSPDGRRCDHRGRLELHHEEPYGRGGEATAENIRILCRAHNQLLAERDYGRGFVRRRADEARRQVEARKSQTAQADQYPNHPPHDHP